MKNQGYREGLTSYMTQPDVMKRVLKRAMVTLLVGGKVMGPGTDLREKCLHRAEVRNSLQKHQQDTGRL